MRPSCFWLLPALSAAVLTAAAAFPSENVGPLQRDAAFIRRDGHHHHGVTLTDFNNTMIIQDLGPTPPSYWSIDILDESDEKRYPGLMAVHVLFMSFAFFGALPVGIALRSVKHACYSLSVIAFYVFVALGLSASSLYKKLTPDMYENNIHGSQGYFFLLIAVFLSSLDLFALAPRLVSYIRSIRSSDISFTFSSFWHIVILGKDDHQYLAGSNAEYAGLVIEDPDEYEEQELKVASGPQLDQMLEQTHVRKSRTAVKTTIEPTSFDADDTNWAQSAASDRTLFNHSHSGSVHSDETLPDLPPLRQDRKPWYKNVGKAAFATVERILVFAGFLQTLTGIVVYTGGCRAGAINICLAHLIKGGIFWCYGLVSFGRFLGSFSELGWAWNRIPASHRNNVPTAEFVESLVIFIYGITNTWMERFGARPGDPYTTKQVQHISIAVMFWFAGLLGMGLESKTFRKWLAAAAVVSQHDSIALDNRGQQNSVAEPPSYSASFNPFPALCIGVTGLAMAAHFQQFQFEVQVHTLWGNMLFGFAMLRSLTYFFLWLAPPRSILPSRPPTEALGSFFLACGGLLFMFSTQDLTIAAMRQGRDDVMMFLNVAVAITCFVFCWCMSIVSFKGFLKSRKIRSIKFHSSA